MEAEIDFEVIDDEDFIDLMIAENKSVKQVKELWETLQKLKESK